MAAMTGEQLVSRKLPLDAGPNRLPACIEQHQMRHCVQHGEPVYEPSKLGPTCTCTW